MAYIIKLLIVKPQIMVVIQIHMLPLKKRKKLVFGNLYSQKYLLASQIFLKVTNQLIKLL